MRELLFIIGLFVLFSCQRHTNGKIGGNSTTEETKVVAEIIQSTCPDEKHPHMIDLGLPSGTKWSCCNTDALSPEDSGGYYAWGETKEKDIYDDTSYLYSEGEDPEGNRWYDGDIQWTNIGTYICGTKYDVARVKWGGKWRMPTSGQFQELIDNSTYKWVKLNDIEGGLFVSKSNGNSIFLPAAGCRLGSDLPDNKGADGPWGGYWSGTRHSMKEYFAYHLYIYDGKARVDIDNMWGLVMGFPIRPVVAP